MHGKVFITLSRREHISQAISRKKTLKATDLNQWSFPPYKVFFINTREEKIKYIA